MERPAAFAPALAVPARWRRAAPGPPRRDRPGHHVDRRQALIIHAPAVMQAVVERDMHDLAGRRPADRLERAGEIDPVEAENYLRGLQPRRHSSLVKLCGAWTCSGWSVGNAAAVFSRRADTRAQPFGERDPRASRLHAARYAAGEDHGMLAPHLSHAACGSSPPGPRPATGGMKRLDVDAGNGFASFASCISASRLM